METAEQVTERNLATPVTSLGRRWPRFLAILVVAVTVSLVVSGSLPGHMNGDDWGWAVGGLFVVGLGLVALGVRADLDASSSRAALATSKVATEAGVALTTGAAIGLVLFMATGSLEQHLLDTQQRFEEDRFTRDARRDDIRYVRETVGQRDPDAPRLGTLDLREASLIGLDFSGARFFGTQLADANVFYSDFSNATLLYTDLSEANLGYSNFTSADLTGSNLRDADLTSANLSGAVLTGVNLAEANLTCVVYDDETVWPNGFDRLPPRQPANECR